MELGIKLREVRSQYELPLVMFSSSVGKPLDFNKKAKDVFATYISKPVRQSQLFDTVMNVLSGSKISVTSESKPKAKIDGALAERIPVRILLAEDNAVNQKVAIQILKKMGYNPDVAANGFEVLQLLGIRNYDIIFMDIQMPEMDGFEATQEIIKRWGTSNRPKIIAMTANALQGDKEKCLEAGMDDYISKPLKVEEIQYAIERWGKSKRPKKISTIEEILDKMIQVKDIIKASVSSSVSFKEVIDLVLSLKLSLRNTRKVIRLIGKYTEFDYNLLTETIMNEEKRGERLENIGDIKIASRWQVYNALTDFITHHLKTKDKTKTLELHNKAVKILAKIKGG